MPNLERRYVPADGKVTSAWLFGLIDAVEFMQQGHKFGGNREGWFELTMSQLVEDIANYAEENWKEEFANVEGRSALPLSEGSSGSDRTEEASATGRPARPWENFGSFRSARGVGPAKPLRFPRHIDSHPASQRKKRLDQIDRDIYLAETSPSACGGSGQWFVTEEGKLVGSCTCLLKYCTNNRGGQS